MIVGVGLSQHTTELDSIALGANILGEGPVCLACIGLVNAVDLEEVIGTLHSTTELVDIKPGAVKLDCCC